MPGISRFFILPLALTVCTALAGCWMPGYRPGGSQASRDLFTYPSTVDHPQSVRVINTATHETVFEVDIPIGRQLVIWFYDDQKTGSTDTPSVMRWEVMDLGRLGGDLNNALPVPGPGSRRVDSFLRTSPAMSRDVQDPILPPTPPALPPPEPTFFPR
jgi:hypothetical protein